MSVINSKQFYFIRHGQSNGQPIFDSNGNRISPKPCIDDPLSDIGINQANNIKLNFNKYWKNEKNILVLSSPLSRALKTACIIFGNNNNVKIELIPELREFNHFQKVNQDLYCRHVGSSWNKLKSLFSDINNINWPSNNDIWWEPHGDFGNCVDRIQNFITNKLIDIINNNTCVVIVCHENVYRILSGEYYIPNCTPTKCFIQSIQHPQRSFPNLLISQQFSDMILSIYKPNIQPLSILCVLGCSNKEICENRILKGFELLQENIHSILIFLGSKTENIIFFSYTRLYINNNDINIDFTNRILMDPFSRTTECNSDLSFMRILSIFQSTQSYIHSINYTHLLDSKKYNIHIITSYWHIPRAWLIYKVAFKKKYNLNINIIPCSASLLLQEEENKNHYYEHIIFTSVLHKNISYWKELLLICKKEIIQCRQRVIRGNTELLISKSYKEQTLQTLKDLLLDELRVKNHNISKIIDICCKAYSSGIPIILFPLYKNGSTALHYAASYESLELLEIFTYIFGGDISAINNINKTPLYYSEEKKNNKISQEIKQIYKDIYNI